MPRLLAEHRRPPEPARHRGPLDAQAGGQGPAADPRGLVLNLRRIIFAALLLAFPAAAEPLRLSTQAVDLHPRDAKVTRIGQLDFVAGFELSSGHARFGGYSGLVIDEGGQRLVAVSDLGQWLVARLQRDEAGRLRGVSDAEIHPILDRGGNPFTVKRAGDAEALEKLPDGSFLVAFEQVHRLARYAGPEPWRSRGEPQVAPREISRQPANGGIESMARLPDGRIILISETDERAAGMLRAWIGSAGTWRDAMYRRRGDYRPVDVKALANGDLLVL
ncbi:MAG: hypothetical protein FJX60_08645, partial [Alphaproteobacteria bacterium]|nr:hypothetical protein [Alphaproteobacteria bacterium]